MAVSFNQYWNAWTKVIERMPAADDVDDHDRADHHRPDPNRHAQKGFQGQAGTLVLRDQIEHADRDDDDHRDLAQSPRSEPELGEVRNGVRPGAAQRGRDEQQQSEVAGGESDRIPQRVGAVLGDQPGDAEK